jgi:hypothetical protein
MGYQTEHVVLVTALDITTGLIIVCAWNDPALDMLDYAGCAALTEPSTSGLMGLQYTETSSQS